MTGQVYIIAAPSGAGKSTLVAALLSHEKHIRLSVSYTTRAPRSGEVDGREYHFISTPAFEAMAAAGEFLESAVVYGNHYATSARWIQEAVARADDVILEIDWQGARQVRRIFPGAVGIFIVPPSIAALEARLVARGKDSPEVIQRRLAAAREDLSHVEEFDYVIINTEFSEAAKDLTGIVRSERCRRPRQFQLHPDLFDKLR